MAAPITDDGMPLIGDQQSKGYNSMDDVPKSSGKDKDLRNLSNDDQEVCKING